MNKYFIHLRLYLHYFPFTTDLLLTSPPSSGSETSLIMAVLFFHYIFPIYSWAVLLFFSFQIIMLTKGHS